MFIPGQRQTERYTNLIIVEIINCPRFPFRQSTRTSIVMVDVLRQVQGKIIQGSGGELSRTCPELSS